MANTTTFLAQCCIILMLLGANAHFQVNGNAKEIGGSAADVDQQSNATSQPLSTDIASIHRFHKARFPFCIQGDFQRWAQPLFLRWCEDDGTPCFPGTCASANKEYTEIYYGPQKIMTTLKGKKIVYNFTVFRPE